MTFSVDSIGTYLDVSFRHPLQLTESQNAYLFLYLKPW